MNENNQLLKTLSELVADGDIDKLIEILHEYDQEFIKCISIPIVNSLSDLSTETPLSPFHALLKLILDFMAQYRHENNFVRFGEVYDNCELFLTNLRKILNNDKKFIEHIFGILNRISYAKIATDLCDVDVATATKQ